MLKENTIKLYEKSFIDHWELPCLSDYNEKTTLTYGDFAKQIARLHILFEQCGIQHGDKIALIGKNTPNWVTVFISTAAPCFIYALLYFYKNPIKNYILSFVQK